VLLPAISAGRSAGSSGFRSCARAGAGAWIRQTRLSSVRNRTGERAARSATEPIQWTCKRWSVGLASGRAFLFGIASSVPLARIRAIASSRFVLGLRCRRTVRRFAWFGSFTHRLSPLQAATRHSAILSPSPRGWRCAESPRAGLRRPASREHPPLLHLRSRAPSLRSPGDTGFPSRSSGARAHNRRSGAGRSGAGTPLAARGSAPASDAGGVSSRGCG
jgi:hypothetical protein